MDLEKIDAALAETVQCDETVYSGKLVKIHRLTVQLPNAKTSTREMLVHPGAAAVVALDDQGNVMIERQWRAACDCAFWEIPAGKTDPEEGSFTTAKRELAEEAGLEARHWVHLGTIHNAIGYSNEHIELYFASGLKKVEQNLDDNEFLSLHWIPFKKVLRMSRNGAITDVKTLVAINWVRAYLRGKLPQARTM